MDLYGAIELIMKERVSFTVTRQDPEAEYSAYVAKFIHPTRKDDPDTFTFGSDPGNIQEAIISYAEVLNGTYVE